MRVVRSLGTLAAAGAAVFAALLGVATDAAAQTTSRCPSLIAIIKAGSKAAPGSAVANPSCIDPTVPGLLEGVERGLKTLGSAARHCRGGVQRAYRHAHVSFGWCA